MIIQNKGLLYTILSKLSRIIERRPDAPVNECVRFDSDGRKLQLASTDGTTWLSGSLPVDDPFHACMPAKPLLEFLKPTDRADREGIVEFKAVENNQVVVAVDGSMITLPASPLEDFPKSPTSAVTRTKWIKSWCIPDFRDALAWVLLAVGLDETRPAMTAVLFDLDCVVAMDGHRLHRAQLSGFGWPTLLASRSVAALVSVLPKTGVLELLRGSDVLVFRAGEWELVTKPVEAQFPPYHRVIPSESCEKKFHAVVNGLLVKAALRRFPRSSLGSTNGIRLKINGAIEMGASSDAGCASATVPVIETTHSGPDFCMDLNAGYLRDAVTDSEREIALRFSGEFDPVVVRPAQGKLAVIMPMRI
jgi:DNA polymerase III sliding clamp (beta) subunit (PCNA family)